jgi:hypothetical protein
MHVTKIYFWAMVAKSIEPTKKYNAFPTIKNWRLYSRE